MNINKHNNTADGYGRRLRNPFGLAVRKLVDVTVTPLRYGPRDRNREAGQVLLIAVMLLAVTLTVVLSITFSSRTDTQITKLEEENQKALAAAEAGIEAALKTAGTVIIGDTGTVPSGGARILSGPGFEGQASVSEEYDQKQFTSPILQKDEQFTFYMGTYNPSTNAIAASVAEDLVICFGSSNQSTKSAVEITLVKGSGPYTLKRYVVDPVSPVRITGAEAGSSCPDTSFLVSKTLDDTTDISTDTKLVIVRMLYSASKVSFSRASTNLPSQGKFVSSEATSDVGVSKKVQLFQSYPQIPADFFVTSF